MVRHCKPQLGVKRRKRYEKDDIMKAVDDVNTGMPIRAASKKHGIPKSVINRHQKAPRTSKPGHPTVLGQEVDHLISSRLVPQEYRKKQAQQPKRDHGQNIQMLRAVLIQRVKGALMWMW